jgi:menaquinone-dependent protoporphyrinogen oxidase
MMNTLSVLVAYATRYGSTQEVAAAITTTLREDGIKVNLQPMQDVKNLDNYNAVVLGAAIYNARWHPEAHIFLAKYQETLRQIPVAIFALGPLSTSEAAMQRSCRQLDMELEKYPWLKPVAVEIFVGKSDPTKLGVLDRLFSRASDFRDWQAIRAWANALPAQLVNAEAVWSQVE